MANQTMPAIEVLRKHPVQLPHPPRQIRLGRLHNQLVMIRHQEMRMAPPVKPLAQRRKHPQPRLAVLVIPIDILTPILTGCHVIQLTS